MNRSECVRVASRAPRTHRITASTVDRRRIAPRIARISRRASLSSSNSVAPTSSIHRRPAIRVPAYILQNTIRIRVQYTYCTHTPHQHRRTRARRVYTHIYIPHTVSLYGIHDRSVTIHEPIYRPIIRTRPWTPAREVFHGVRVDRARCEDADDGAFESWRVGLPRDAIAVAVSSSRRRCRRRRR